MRRAPLAWPFLLLCLGIPGAVAGQNVPNYMEQGGARWVIGGSLDVASGGDLDIESGGSLKIGGTALTCSAAELNALAGTGLSAAELGVLNGITAGTAAASKALVLDANSAISSFRTTDGVGAVAGAGVALVEIGSGAGHKTVFTLTSASVTVTDTGGVNGAQGNFKIYDFPEGVIVRGGCVASATTLAGAGGIADGAAVVLSLGSAAAGAGDATLSGTEADFIASFAGTLTAGAGTFAKYGEPSVTSLDGHTTAVDLILNVAVPDADVSSSDTLEVSGTITCVWTLTGDFT